ncbi:MAG TPA: hydroxyisourate hydrolase [Candidatus Dormibacteraeota bacterium]|nr:hydroxyisourate hydrolase [Candidatus Dormibacteraeota bacterium]
MSAITSHVLDLSLGKPASGVFVTLELRNTNQNWKVLGSGKTDADGRVKNLLADEFRLESGTYRIHFDVAEYFRAQNVESFYPEASVVFTVRDSTQHYHVPLLLSPHGYTTYRGN